MKNISPILISLLPSIISGVFLIISVRLGANIIAKRTQMRNYSRQLENWTKQLSFSKRLLEKNFNDFISNKGVPGNWYEIYKKELENYNSKVYEYNSLITEINLFCAVNIQPKFFYANFNDDSGEINYEK